MAIIGPGFWKGGAALSAYLGGRTPATPTAPSAPAGSASTTTASSAWASDPGYQAALAAQTQGNAAASAQYTSSVDQLLAQFGDPNFASWAGFNDPQAQALAHQNYLSGNSTLARLDQAHSLAKKNVVDTLASHGILRSGDLGYRTHLADQSYGQSVYDAEQSLLQQIAGLQNTRLTAYQGFQQGVTTALQQAWQNYIANPGLYTNPTAPPPPSAPSANSGVSSTAYTKPRAAPSAFGGANAPITPTNFYTDTSLSAQSRPRKRAVIRQLSNPYVTGQKTRG